MITHKTGAIDTSV